MNIKESSLENFAVKAAREFAANRSVALSKYSDLLSKFGKGELQVSGFNEAAAKLALEESVRYAQDTLKLGGAYWGFWAQATGTLDPSQSRPAAAHRTSTASSRAHRRPGRSSRAKNA